MRKVLYVTELNDCKVHSLRELRTHVQFFTRVCRCNWYDDDYVQRFVWRGGTWVCDPTYLARISLVRGKVVLRRVRTPRIPDVGAPV